MQDVMHVYMFCPERKEGWREMLEAAETNDCKTLKASLRTS